MHKGRSGFSGFSVHSEEFSQGSGLQADSTEKRLRVFKKVIVFYIYVYYFNLLEYRILNPESPVELSELNAI